MACLTPPLGLLSCGSDPLRKTIPALSPRPRVAWKGRRKTESVNREHRHAPASSSSKQLQERRHASSRPLRRFSSLTCSAPRIQARKNFLMSFLPPPIIMYMMRCLRCSCSCSFVVLTALPSRASCRFAKTCFTYSCCSFTEFAFASAASVASPLARLMLSLYLPPGRRGGMAPGRGRRRPPWSQTTGAVAPGHRTRRLPAGAKQA
mmetsp:Transcript_72727/g.165034  ORF Transcript_72727/g.165034 Transcript_72727/m.165034 type:complete len:206 (+) Transcript_72727:426-1043(+)